ncbi:hypothetical protein EJ08DRAFT_430298 [Tothia fuscella]|uniref:F-box domain-containing protein n=1 Tax=Tothia fuscella TaxID=1048955 RepID=A0A9P4P039_9PEZI|nr:hypothetical protein EJ08DRAFT_430298 [Tothia fuscella]
MAIITSLPMELMEHVTHNVDVEDFCNLRLSCRDVSSKIQKELYRRFHAKKTIETFDKSTEDFQAFLAMTKAGFAKHVRHIEIQHAPRNDDIMCESLADFTEAFKALQYLEALSIHVNDCVRKTNAGHGMAVGSLLMMLLEIFSCSSIQLKALYLGCVTGEIFDCLRMSGQPDGSVRENLEILQCRNQTFAEAVYSPFPAYAAAMVPTTAPGRTVSNFQIIGATKTLQFATRLTALRVRLGPVPAFRKLSLSQSLISIEGTSAPP